MDSLATFIHPHGVYRLEYPATWEFRVEKEGESCGFGPRDRDDVGLWISIMPMSIDTDRLVEALPGIMRQSMPETETKNLRSDPTLRHHGLVGDIAKEGQGGHHWILAAGDVVLVATTQVPVNDRDVWNPQFQRVLVSLHITRDKELIDHQTIRAVLDELAERMPDQEFTVDGYRLQGTQQSIFLGNLCADVRTASPSKRAAQIRRFVAALTQRATADIGSEQWEEVHGKILPLLKPQAYIDPNSPTQHLLTTEWLLDVLICYVIARAKLLRFVTGWDVNRWGLDATKLHEQAMTNLTRLPWPDHFVGSRAQAGRVILVQTADGLASSRLLHPDLHKLFAPPLGNPFWAGIPSRDTLVLYSDRKAMKQRIERRLAKDSKSSAYPITPRPFLVTRDGIAPPE